MEEVKNIASVLALIGVPPLCSCAIFFAKACVKFSKKIDILMNAQQKQMRRELTMDFHKYMAEDHIDDDDLDMWEQAYQAYHALGKNGIMDNYRQKLIELNTKVEGK